MNSVEKQSTMQPAELQVQKVSLEYIIVHKDVLTEKVAGNDVNKLHYHYHEAKGL